MFDVKQKKAYLFLLGLIIIISIFFRTYQIVERFGFDHDNDLSSWIVKDIVANKHFRLIGQLTSAPGIFIGPIFYYLLVPFFLLFNMDPVGSVIPVTIIGLLTTLSYYFVFSRLFTQVVGLISAFLQATLLSSVIFDRRIAPNTPANLWSVWYFYTILRISQGDFSVLPLLGILIGLIWHIHIALAPSLIAIPIAFFVSKKLPKIKQIAFCLIAFLVTSTPLFLFEARHGFSQTGSFIQNFTINHGGEKGLPKLLLVLDMISKNINTLFLSPQSLPPILNHLFLLILILLGAVLVIKKVIPAKITAPLSAWLIGIIVFFTLSSSLISEYYFYSIEIIFIFIVSLTLYSLLKFSKATAALTIILLSTILIKNVFHFVTIDIYHKGYVERKAVVDFIAQDARSKNYPCVGVSYVAAIGENVGFRYFFYLKNLHLVHPSLKVPVYNIAIPDELAVDPKDKKFGHIGVIAPKIIPSEKDIEESCRQENTNLTDPMLGYVD